MSRAYEYRHVVTFQDTNVVGNVYFVNHLAWQGACREHFLRDHAPDVLAELRGGLALMTVSCSCEYLVELSAFDEIAIRMTLADTMQNRIDLRFAYVRISRDGEQLVAVGRQQIACMRHGSGGPVACEVPTALRAALAPYR